jgi:hypothetical protein
MDKKCNKCEVLKPLVEFSHDKSKKDGYHNTCKSCTSQYNREWRAKNILYIKAYNRNKYRKNASIIMNKVKQWRQANPDKKERQNRIWVETHPAEYKAHNILNAAVRDGKIHKLPWCEKCGEYGDIQGHHCDYSKPLEVIWLCSKCHSLVTQIALGKGT